MLSAGDSRVSALGGAFDSQLPPSRLPLLIRSSVALPRYADFEGTIRSASSVRRRSERADIPALRLVAACGVFDSERLWKTTNLKHPTV